jgi:hypothetical protein
MGWVRRLSLSKIKQLLTKQKEPIILQKFNIIGNQITHNLIQNMNILMLLAKNITLYVFVIALIVLKVNFQSSVCL